MKLVANTTLLSRKKELIGTNAFRSQHGKSSRGKSGTGSVTEQNGLHLGDAQPKQALSKYERLVNCAGREGKGVVFRVTEEA